MLSRKTFPWAIAWGLMACSSRLPESSVSSATGPSWAAPPLETYLAGRSILSPYEAKPKPVQGCFDVSFQSRSGRTELILSCDEDEFFQSFADPLDRFEKNRAPLRSRLGAKIFPKRGAYWISEDASGKSTAVHLTDLEGGERRLLGEHASETAISDDGERIVFVSRPPGAPARLIATSRKKSDRATLDVGVDDLSFPAFWGSGLLWYERTGADGWRLARGTLEFPHGGGVFARLSGLRREKLFLSELYGPPVAVPGEDGRFVQAGVFRGRSGLYLIDFTARLDGLCLKLLRKADEPRHVAFSSDGRYLAWIEGRQILVAPFSLTNAPCDGSRTGVEWNRMRIQGVSGQ